MCTAHTILYFFLPGQKPYPSASKVAADGVGASLVNFLSPKLLEGGFWRGQTNVNNYVGLHLVGRPSPIRNRARSKHFPYCSLSVLPTPDHSNDSADDKAKVELDIPSPGTLLCSPTAHRPTEL